MPEHFQKMNTPLTACQNNKFWLEFEGDFCQNNALSLTSEGIYRVQEFRQSYLWDVRDEGQRQEWDDNFGRKKQTMPQDLN